MDTELADPFRYPQAIIAEKTDNPNWRLGQIKGA
jgi:hypothetical protein